MTAEDKKEIQKESPSVADGDDSKGGCGGSNVNRQCSRSAPILKSTFKGECRAIEDAIFDRIGPHRSASYAKRDVEIKHELKALNYTL